MRLTILICTLLLTLYSCSNINRDYRENRISGKKMRHGIVPIAKASPTKKNKNIIPINPFAASRGSVLYKAHCFKCHGAKGLGDGPQANDSMLKPANLKKTVHDVPNFKFYISVSQWIGKMPGWKNIFSEKEMSDVSHYIRSLAQD